MSEFGFFSVEDFNNGANLYWKYLKTKDGTDFSRWLFKMAENEVLDQVHKHFGAMKDEADKLLAQERAGDGG